MYLMMLLATFMSAIYGYNLSVRSDYDRDIAKKKAMAVIYKFNHQHVAVVSAIKHGMNVPDIINQQFPDGFEDASQAYSLYDITFPFPNSTFSGHFFNDYKTIPPYNIISGSNKEKKIAKRIIYYRNDKYLKKKEFYPIPAEFGFYPIALTTVDLPGTIEEKFLKNYATDSLVMGQSVFDDGEMTSRLFCTDSIRPGEKQKTDEYGNPVMDENGNPVMETVQVEPLSECDMSSYSEAGADGTVLYSGTCCSTANKKILVSYMKMDPRWVDRVTGELSMDFWNALSPQPFRDNIGIIKWLKDTERRGTYGEDIVDPEAGKEGWTFIGKLHYIEAYAPHMDAWVKKHGAAKSFPLSARRKTRWNLPHYFSDKKAFVDQWGNEMCTEPQGCLFRISEI